MEIFEIHITGDKGINKILDDLCIKNIVVNLLKPDLRCLRTEYMSSTIQKFKNYSCCLKWMEGLCLILQAHEINIIRKKIECPPIYEQYLNNTLYVESHWKIDPLINDTNIYPLSENAKSKKILATDRVYDPNYFNDFISKNQGKEVEYCLYDSFIEEDFDWFKLYNL